MKLKKFFSAFCLAAGLAFAAPALSSTIGITQDMSTVQAAEGWNEDSTGWYYEKDGARLKSQIVTINGATYYFNADGYRTSGVVKSGDKAYYFSASNGGKLLTGISGKLAQVEGTDTYYYFKEAGDGTIATDSWVTFNSKYYYAGSDGKIQLGTIKVNGLLYHVTLEDGRLTSYKFSSYDGKCYYASASGVLKTGLKKISGKRYYFDPITGERRTGTVTIGDNTYTFSATTGAARTGWVKIDGKYYYHSKKTGKRLYGLRTINKKTYLLRKADNGARATSGWYKVGKKYRYFNSKGVQQTGFITINGKTYYSVKFGSNSGTRKTGWMTLDGRKYYFRKTNGVMKTGWFTSKGKTYYFNPVKTSSTYGAAKTGWVKIKGSWYHFDDDGVMETGWIVDNLKRYYLDPKTGKMLTGKQKINGTTYDLGTSGGIAITGSYEIHVNRKQNCITIYKGGYPVKAMICSTALSPSVTPTGTFYLRDKLRWHELMGPSWGQYCSHITDDILFHSVTYTQYCNNRSLSTAAYNMLGQPASHGCIRLQVIDAKWMYDNCPIGTKVVISDTEAMPLGKPTISKIPSTQNYDPTDPNI